MYCQRKPEKFEVIRWNGKNEKEIHKIIRQIIGKIYGNKKRLFINNGALIMNTKDGYMIANPGDYITIDEDGKVFPYSPIKFEEIFELIEEEVLV